MKITDLSVTMFSWDNIPETKYTRKWKPIGGSVEMGLVTIHTDQGIEGHSFLGNSSQSAAVDVAQLLSTLKPVVMGQDPLERGRLYSALWSKNRFFPIRCIGAVDVALWDLAGKAANMPVHQLIGTCRERAPAYASSALQESPEAYAEEALYYKSKGWTAYKIHPPAVPKEDIEVCEAVRKAVGDDMVLMLDSVWAYCYEDAVRVGRAIEEMGYYWYEDPLAEDDMYGYIKLRQKLDIPILATEANPGGLYPMAQFITAQATDMLRGDVAVKGGITPMLKIAYLAEAFRMKCEVHHGGNSLNNVANLNLTMAIENCDYFEVLLPDHAQKYGLVKDIKVDAEGYVHAPTGPGLGAEIDFDLIKKKTTRVLR
ncbi:MAG: mandelate racemase [SAR202 cluster bacterium]|nr:mandelate racemase [SAR202 cluster bacterium]